MRQHHHHNLRQVLPNTQALGTMFIPTHNRFFWAVEKYLDLITARDRLEFGKGTKVLYAVLQGTGRFDYQDTIAVADKAIRLGIIPDDISSFGYAQVRNNIQLYGTELIRLISERVSLIINGNVSNPRPFSGNNQGRVRRNFYTPPLTLVTGLQKVADACFRPEFAEDTLRTAEFDALSCLAHVRDSRSFSAESQTSWGALLQALKVLSWHLSMPWTDHIACSRVLRILWVIAKMVYGDVIASPLLRDMNVGLRMNKCFVTDGTAAALPWPTANTMRMYVEEYTRGTSPRAKAYLDAVSLDIDPSQGNFDA
jgi:hypothetical protein